MHNIYKPTGRQTDILSERQAFTDIPKKDIRTERQVKQTEILTNSNSQYKLTYRHIDRHAYCQTDRHTVKKADRRTDKKSTDRQFTQSQTKRQADRQTAGC